MHTVEDTYDTRIAPDPHQRGAQPRPRDNLRLMLDGDRHLAEMAAKYVEDGSVPDIETGLRKARAIAKAAHIYLDALIRIETEKAIDADDDGG